MIIVQYRKKINPSPIFPWSESFHSPHDALYWIDNKLNEEYETRIFDEISYSDLEDMTGEDA